MGAGRMGWQQSCKLCEIHTNGAMINLSLNCHAPHLLPPSILTSRLPPPHIPLSPILVPCVQ